MERSRSKRGHYYEHDSDSQASPPPPPRAKGRYHHGGHYGGGNHHRRGGDRRPLPPPTSSSSSASKFQDAPPPSTSITTSFRILCPEEKTGIVIGKAGCFLKAFRQETGAWITAYELAPGDDELIIETSDNRRREPDGRPPHYSPAQDALLMIHDRMLDAGFELDGDLEDDEYGGGWDRGRTITRLVVPRGHVGCLMGKGGKIIEQMRIETKTHIRILPRDQHTPRCVSSSEEIVQVVGDSNAVKKAVAIISSRLKESLHRDRGSFRGRPYSPERYLPADDEFAHNLQHRPDEVDSGHRPRTRNSSYPSRSSAHPTDLDGFLASNNTYEEIIFRIICPNEKVEIMTDDSSGFLEMLHSEVGVEIHVMDPVPGSDERVVVVTSEEGPNDELFPAQEALLHIQSRILDLAPDKENMVTTKLLLPSGSAACLSDLRKSTHASIQILPKEEIPNCAHGPFDLIQIVGEIRAAREALIQITSRLRSFLFYDVSTAKESPNSEDNEASEQVSEANQELKIEPIERKPEDPIACGNGSLDLQQESQVQEEQQQRPGLQSQKILKVSIPELAVPSLVMRSGHKLAQIGEMSGAKLSLIEGGTEQQGKVVQISGSPEQAERAQSLLQGFILSTL